MFTLYCSYSRKSKKKYMKEARETQQDKNMKEYEIKYNFQIKEKIEKTKKTKEQQRLLKIDTTPCITIDNPDYLNIIYNKLKEDWPDILINIKTNKLPWIPTYTIPSLNLYIDMHVDSIHNGRPYLDTKQDRTEYSNLIKEGKNDIASTWRDKDTYKRNYVINNHIDWMEFFEPELDYIQNSIKLFSEDYQIKYTEEELRKELKVYTNNPGRLSIHCQSNKIVKTFTQKSLYKEEYNRYHNPIWKWKLDNNRLKYILNKRSQLTSEIIMRGFKIMLHIGYSFFNPTLFKWFIERFNLQGANCYDPCGGWGHRLLGSNLLGKYIYNDLSHTTNIGVQNMCHWLGWDDKVTFYENDATTFMPSENYDAMFTCPPYFDPHTNENNEIYECDPFNSWSQYIKFIDALFDKFYNKESCKYFGLVIREDMLEDKWKKRCIESHKLRNINSHLTFNSEKQYSEYIYLFKK